MAVATPEKPSETLGTIATEGARFSKLATLVAVGIFATGLPQPGVLGSLPFNHFLRQHLHADAATISTFTLWTTLPWLLKPFAGLLSDSFPLMKSRRRSYLIAGLALAALSWIALSRVPQEFNSLVWACILVNVFMMVASTVTGGILVEAGRATAATGRLTSIRVLIQNFITLISGPVGGMIAVGGLVLLSGISAAILIAAIPAVFLLLRKEPEIAYAAPSGRKAIVELKNLFTNRNVLLAILATILFYFAPGFGTVQYLRQTNQYGFSDKTVGYFWGISSAFGILAAVCYFVLCKKVNLRTLIITGIVLNAAGNFAYILYTKNFAWDAVIEAQNGVFFALCEVALYDLAARVIPEGCEAMGYGLLISMQIACFMGGGLVGSFLVAREHLEFWKLLALNSGSTLCVLLVVWWLPRQITSAFDGSPRRAAEPA